MLLAKWVTSMMRYLSRPPPVTANLTGATFNTYAYFNVNVEAGLEQELPEPAQKKRKTGKEKAKWLLKCNDKFMKPVRHEKSLRSNVTMKSALGLPSKMILPMNAPIFTATQLTPKIIISKPTDTFTHESRYFSKDSIKDSLTIWVLLYTKLRIPITISLFHVLRNDSERNRTKLMNIQYLMFFYFVLSLTFIKVKL